MRYKIKLDGKIIQVRSENAALTSKHPSRPLIKIIQKFEPVDRSLDYGCGKLRYTKILRGISQRVDIVDSDIQLEREQVIYGAITSIKKHVHKNWNDVCIMNVQEFKKSAGAYDLILCANVLSAIPSKKVFFDVLVSLKKKLGKNGRCLIVNQHTNSHFTKWKLEGRRYAYGWLYKGRKGYSYFGIINKKILKKSLSEAGFLNCQIWIEGQSTFALCS